jgi:hypothetical protein
MGAIFMGAINHAPRIILLAFTGAGAITPVSWQALGYTITDAISTLPL